MISRFTVAIIVIAAIFMHLARPQKSKSPNDLNKGHTF
jgi:hypothetical protein